MLFLTSIGSLLAEESAPFNIMCPVYSDEPSDPEITTIHDGKPVYFCCKKCVRTFREDPGKFAKNIIYQHEANAPEIEGGDDHDYDHDHEHGKGALNLLGKFHPAIIHFPIAGIFFAFFLQMLAHVKKNEEFQESIGLILLLTTAFTILAGISGWINAHGQSVSGSDLKAIDLHRWFGLATGVSIVLCTFSQRKDSPKTSLSYGLYMGLLILSLILSSVTGHLGGILVFGSQYFQI